MSQGFFVTGTDTEIGKTFITCALINLAVQKGYKVAGMKPIASGCEQTKDGLRNDDAIKIIEEMNTEFEYKRVNQYSFIPPVSPHFAARAVNKTIDIAKIKQNYLLIKKQTDMVFVEGVGGWEVPLGEDIRVADLASTLDLPVVMVVGLKLGCINHALLTAKAIENKGLKIVAVIATEVEKGYEFLEQTIKTLEKQLEITVQHVPWLETPNADIAAKHLQKIIKEIDENI